MLRMNRATQAARFALAFAVLAGIVLVYREWLPVNPTTVALTLLLLILVLAARWGLRYAVAVSLAATACYNFFFLPPVGTFTITDPQNWIALIAFLVTAIVASRLSEAARSEAEDARVRQHELDILYRLGRELLQSDSASAIAEWAPAAIARVTGAKAVHLELGNEPNVQPPDTPLGPGDLRAALRSGARQRGGMVIAGANVTQETADAIAGLVSISMDRAQALEAAARSEAAKQAERLRSLMLDSVTHQIRTPLTSIKGAATALLSQGAATEEMRELLTIVDEEADRLNALVAEAVETAQLETENIRLNLRRVPVSELVREAVEAAPSVIEAHPLNVDVPGDMIVLCDPVLLQKVLVNLLDNAAKYSLPGAAIRIAAARAEGGVSLSIADEGQGVAPEERDLIFEKFYRGKSAGGTAGSGRGLAIARAVLQAHGGDVRLAGATQSGSTFTIFLPEKR